MKNLTIATVLASTALPVMAADGDHPVSLEFLAGQADTTTTVDNVGERSDEVGSLGARLAFAFSDYLALETSYMQYGETDDEYTDPNNTSQNIKDKIETKSVNLGLKASLPITDYFALSVRGGAAKWDVKAKQDLGVLGSVKATDDGVDPYYGVGAEFQIADRFIVGAEYTILKAELSDNYLTGDHEIKNAALVLGYQF